MEMDQILIENSRRIYLENEIVSLKEGLKKFSAIAMEGNPEDKNVVEYLREELNRSIDKFIEKAVKMK